MNLTVAELLKADFWNPIRAQYRSEGIEYVCPDPFNPSARSAGAICFRIMVANASCALMAIKTRKFRVRPLRGL